jgi:nicotinamidase-related amidase
MSGPVLGDLAELAAAPHTAIVTQECQGAIIGTDAGLGSNHKAALFAIGRRGVDIAPGSPGASLLPELGPEPTDLVLSRYHGVGPMGGTDLDAVLRNLGVSTIVAVGVSLNVAIRT